MAAPADVPGTTRTSVPFILPDVLTVSDPALIRRFAVHQDIGRLAQGQIPHILRAYLFVSKFYSPATGQFALGFESTEEHTVQRRAAIEEKLGDGLSDGAVAELAKLLARPTPASDRELAVRACMAVAPHILRFEADESMPESIAADSVDTMRGIEGLKNPFGWWKARCARKRIEEYVASRLPKGVLVADAVHNLGAAAHGFGDALKILRDEKSVGDAGTLLTGHPIAKTLIRIPLVETNFDGLFAKPLVPDSTIIFLSNGTAAGETKDDLFVFGAGVTERQCPFRRHFFSFTERLANTQQEGDSSSTPE